MIIDDIALTMQPEIGSRTAMHLIECFGNAEKLYDATAEQIVEIAELKPQIAKSIAAKEYHKRAEKELKFATQNNIKVISVESPGYPKKMRESTDYPHIIYVKGDIDLNSGRWLSIVGTRKITNYGLNTCDRIVAELAEMFPDLVIVSGLAYGVDIASHRAALVNNLLTIGVMGHALTHIYPPQHTDVARRMVDAGGALISEFHSECRPDKSGFVQRNRIIAALSEGTLIVESASKGGSLITADMADGYNRQVMAVPGRVGDPYSAGTNALIKNLKAQMVTSAQDIANILNWERQPQGGVNATMQSLFGAQIEVKQVPEAASEPSVVAGSELHHCTSTTSITSNRILAMIGNENPISFDELIGNLDMTHSVLSALLLDLEFSGKIRTLPGKQYIRK